ncbi:hypothetical protein FPQ18DRAFT_354217, partial [Pyronema domesticum]
MPYTTFHKNNSKTIFERDVERDAESGRQPPIGLGISVPGSPYGPYAPTLAPIPEYPEYSGYIKDTIPPPPAYTPSSQPAANTSTTQYLKTRPGAWYKRFREYSRSSSIVVCCCCATGAILTVVAAVVLIIIAVSVKAVKKNSAVTVTTGSTRDMGF